MTRPVNQLPQFSAPEFIIGSIPWVTSSVVSSKINVPFTDPDGTNRISQFVTVKNTDVSGSFVVGFTSLGVSNTNNFFTLKAGEIYTAPFAIPGVYLSGAAGVKYEIVAGMTFLTTDVYFNITSSNGFGGVG